VNRWTIRIGLAAFVLGTSACVQTFDSVKLGVPVSLAESTDTPVAGDSFRITKHPVWFLWGMIPAGQPKLEDVLAGQLGTGSRLTNVRIRQRMELLDLLITVITVGMASTRSVTFEGVVVPR